MSQNFPQLPERVSRELHLKHLLTRTQIVDRESNGFIEVFVAPACLPEVDRYLTSHAQDRMGRVVVERQYSKVVEPHADGEVHRLDYGQFIVHYLRATAQGFVLVFGFEPAGDPPKPSLPKETIRQLAQIATAVATVATILEKYLPRGEGPLSIESTEVEQSLEGTVGNWSEGLIGDTFQTSTDIPDQNLYGYIDFLLGCSSGNSEDSQATLATATSEPMFAGYSDVDHHLNDGTASACLTTVGAVGWNGDTNDTTVTINGTPGLDSKRRAELETALGDLRRHLDGGKGLLRTLVVPAPTGWSAPVADAITDNVETFGGLNNGTEQIGGNVALITNVGNNTFLH